MFYETVTTRGPVLVTIDLVYFAWPAFIILFLLWRWSFRKFKCPVCGKKYDDSCDAANCCEEDVRWVKAIW